MKSSMSASASSSETPEIRLLQHIHQGSVMGIDSIHHMINLSEEVPENKNFTSALSSQLREYEEVRAEAASLLTKAGETPQGISATSRFMADMTSSMKSMTDRSASRLAEIMVQGSTMGTTNLTRQLNSYNGRDRSVTSLAQKLLKTEERNIEEMKHFL